MKCSRQSVACLRRSPKRPQRSDSIQQRLLRIPRLSHGERRAHPWNDPQHPQRARNGPRGSRNYICL